MTSKRTKQLRKANRNKQLSTEEQGKLFSYRVDHPTPPSVDEQKEPVTSAPQVIASSSYNNTSESSIGLYCTIYISCGQQLRRTHPVPTHSQPNTNINPACRYWSIVSVSTYIGTEELLYAAICCITDRSKT